MTEPKKKKRRDSNTLVYRKLRGGRVVLSIRVKPEIKKALLDFCQSNGVSLCHVFELLATGYLEGMKQKVEWVNQSPTINLNVDRVVKRIRRYKREFVEELTTEEVGSREACALCGERSVAVMFNYPSRSECVSTYLCRRHWREREGRRDFAGFRLL